jgi:hypothetical protein
MRVIITLDERSVAMAGRVKDMALQVFAYMRFCILRNMYS